MFVLRKSFKCLYSCSVRHIFTDSKLFLRKQELAQFTKVFSDPTPKLNIILGPPDSGKTTLVRQVLNESNFWPLNYNCRGGIATLNDIHNQISKQKPNIISKLLNYYKQSLPILVIDEAHLLEEYLYDDEDLKKFFSFLNWLVTQHHVVLTSSDSCFLDWVQKRVGDTACLNPYVVGDLSKEEAEEFFEEHVLPCYECKKFRGQFDNVCKITGTRMSFIIKYIKECMMQNKLIDSSKFSCVFYEGKILEKGLNGERLYNWRLNPHPPAWNKDKLIKTMKAFIKAENQGFILEKDLVKEIGSEAVYSLAYYGLIHRRPTQNFFYDIVNPPQDKVLLTVRSQSLLCAMKCILNKFKLD